MPVPLALAAPTAAAAVAYLNARSSFWYDALLVKGVVLSMYRVASRERNDRLNPFYLLEDRATSTSHAGKVFLWFEGKTYTYADVYDAALRYGTWFKQDCSVRPQEIVAMDMFNSEYFVFIWFALWSIGAKPAFINYNLTGTSLSHCLKAANTRLCICDAELLPKFTEDVRKQCPDVEIVGLTQDVEMKATSKQPVRSPNSDRSEDKLSNMAILIYTSGTTGMPKPAVVSWAKTIAGSTIGSTLLGRDGTDTMYTSMPLYHSSAALLATCASLFAGSTQALGRKFNTKNFWAEVRASNATMIQYVGETLRYLLAAPPQHDPATGECLDKRHKVHLAFGNGLRPDVWSRFKERFGIETIAEFYASTEGPLGLWNLSSNSFASGAMGRHGWIYRAITSFSSAIVEVDADTEKPWRDPQTGFCRRVAVRHPGELLAKLPADEPERRYQGYYGNESASQAKVLRDVFSKGDMWYRTGDVVREDSEGRFYFHDRIGDTFRWKSENVSTAEVSEAMGMHPSVREANVYGLPLPNHDGQAGCAWVWLDAADAETLSSLARHVRSTLPSYAQPLFIRVHSGGTEPPAGQLTGTNKQQKHNLRAAGVKPSSAGGSDDSGLGTLYWLRGDAYVPFELEQWRDLAAGKVKL